MLLKPKRIFLPARIKVLANKKFNLMKYRFKKRYKREPSKEEYFRMIIQISHLIYRKRGNKAHWKRQRVRKYLLEKNRIVKEYIMR
jgi:hypothetical protein